MDDNPIRKFPPETNEESPENNSESHEYKNRVGYHKAIENHEVFKNLNKFDRKLVKGVMRGSGPIIMLWLISKKGLHGYEIMTLLHESSPFFDKVKMPSASLIYPKLHKLEKKGLIKGSWEHHGKRKVKYYEITPEGMETLNRIRNFFKNRGNNLYEEFLEEMMSIKKPQE